MTISTETDKVTHAGNSAATNFSYPFKIFADSDLVVTHVVDATGVENTLTLDVDYTVNGAGDASGSIDYPITGSPLPTGESLILTSAIPLLQSTDLKNQGTFYNEVHEDFFDKIVRIAQQIKALVNRAPVVPVSTTLASNQLPVPAANEAIGWNASADGFSNLTLLDAFAVSAFMKTVLDDATAAEARATLGVDASLFDGTEATVTPTLLDKFALTDNSDADNPKFATLQTMLDTINSLSALAAAGLDHSTDYVGVYDASASATKKVLLQDLAFPSGTKLVFHQTTAPVGWTKEVGASYNDIALRVVTGTVGSGGTDAWSTCFSAAKTTDAHTLTTAEMPAHSHGSGFPAGGAFDSVINKSSSRGTGSTGSAGGGSSHMHNLTIDLKYHDVIIAIKD